MSHPKHNKDIHFPILISSPYRVSAKGSAFSALEEC